MHRALAAALGLVAALFLSSCEKTGNLVARCDHPGHRARPDGTCEQKLGRECQDLGYSRQGEFFFEPSNVPADKEDGFGLLDANLT